MNKIKNFIYLDYEKMYSLSAQLFQGVVFESIAEKGYVFSEKNSLQETKRTSAEHSSIDNTLKINYIKPYDHHYSMFEDKLHDLQKVIDVDKNNLMVFEDEELIKKHPFIKSKGEIIITDPNELYDMLNNFKDISGHINYISESQRLHDIYNELSSLDRTQKSKIGSLRSEAKNIEDEMKFKNECINDTYNKHLAEIMKFSFGEDDIIINQNLQEKLITTYMNRDFFKQKTQSIVKKYARKTSIEFVLFGVATQFKENDWVHPDIGSPEFRDAVKGIILAQHSIENTFSKPGNGEMVIEAISMYTEL
ncbi:DUF6414 family protein [Klebsiella huaxiensis]|uniref:Uncharacterized protein n=1 Tax=Klebsiella huaxiensis TaxID=2153354 RepID=A0A564LAW0_9ENTR|nr:hypothetical protein [Klebsiella huaxiensis]VUS78421.1 hypothetical protein SB6422_02182 [Klebsiella huaxiensis]